MPTFAANLSMLYTELDFLDRFEAAAKDGFRGVEFLFPYDYDKQQLVDRLQGSDLTQVLHNMPPGDWGGGERGLASLPDRVGEFQDGVGRAIDYATALGCRQIHCMAGIPPADAEPERVRDTYVSNIAFAADKLGEAGIRLLIEAINTRDIPGYYVNHTRQTLDLIAASGSDNVYVQYDIYHMQVMEGDLAPTIERHINRISHFQLADTPGRHEPGTGEINYPFLFQFIDALDYDGWIGCEYKPATSTAAGLGWIRPYL